MAILRAGLEATEVETVVVMDVAVLVAVLVEVLASLLVAAETVMIALALAVAVLALAVVLGFDLQGTGRVGLRRDRIQTAINKGPLSSPFVLRSADCRRLWRQGYLLLRQEARRHQEGIARMRRQGKNNKGEDR
ncbi:hypothetical protein NDU88_001240 [Pleurodeles waltl]|uniref:Uncharacterized protein n=1 Tax=Pleurodeles waltl TaxID=8319 RepID=A0AAV7MMW3_PLEWA|nr:hypothetical protein NDU88_001240 [Pleurodeles waltl]